MSDRPRARFYVPPDLETPWASPGSLPQEHAFGVRGPLMAAQPLMAQPLQGPGMVPGALMGVGLQPTHGQPSGQVLQAPPIPIRNMVTTSEPPAPDQGRERHHLVWGGIDTLSNHDSAGLDSSPYNSAGLSRRDVKKLQNRKIHPDDVTFLSNGSAFSSSGTQASRASRASRNDPTKDFTYPGEGTPLGAPLAGDGEGEGLAADQGPFDGESSNSEGGGSDDDAEQAAQREAQMAQLSAWEAAGLDLEELIRQVPLDEHGQPTSIGSIGHDCEACKVPCIYVMRKKPCVNGAQCNFCHLPHKQKRSRQRHKTRPRPCKGKRDRYRKHWETLKNQIEAAPDSFDVEAVELPPSIATYEKLKRKLVTRLQRHQQMLQTTRLQEEDDGTAGAAGPHVQGQPLPQGAAGAGHVSL